MEIFIIILISLILSVIITFISMNDYLYGKKTYQKILKSKKTKGQIVFYKNKIKHQS